MKHHKKYLQSLIRKGGPAPEDYYDLDAWIIEVWEQAKVGLIGEAERKDLIGLLGDAASVETMQGFTLQKPHGYAGDFEIIDRIYEHYVSGGGDIWPIGTFIFTAMPRRMPCATASIIFPA
uniref:Uncharacterized protein n=1 Tax=Candidatus Kentrum sp. FW TaxID=2126338 RepID=A0A450TF49_9GAMM|nr:MAG: hypothetical protein BECKFW1821C_GA0114237_100838 [Candidatus Kentron sp. FW]